MIDYRTSRIIEIIGLKISDVNYIDLIGKISDSISQNRKLLISYANANTINLCFTNKVFKRQLNSLFQVHPDGVGVHFASKFLSPGNGFKSRFSGSDFYPILTEELAKQNLKTYFLGHRIGTLQKISLNYPNLIVCGYHEGYNYDTVSLINEINSLKPALLFIGLGQPLQEEWIQENYDSLDVPVIIAVGDGIKVFAGEKKRGPVFADTWAGVASKIAVQPR
jgi:N-acetylglucosaminyldiphosphoundecaprenol N-acetyl-beta-D-mannosaminyltransferase